MLLPQPLLTAMDEPRKSRRDAILEMIEETKEKVAPEFMSGLYQAGLKTVAPWTAGLCSDLPMLLLAMRRATGIATKYVFVGATPSVSFAARALEVLIGRLNDDVVARNKWMPRATVLVTSFRGLSDDLSVESDDAVSEHASSEETVVIQLLANAWQEKIITSIRDRLCSCYALWSSGLDPDDEALLKERHQLIWRSPAYGPDKMAWHVYSLRMPPEFGRASLDPCEIGL